MLVRPPEDLWSHFHDFSDKNIAGLTMNLNRYKDRAKQVTNSIIFKVAFPPCQFNPIHTHQWKLDAFKGSSIYRSKFGNVWPLQTDYKTCWSGKRTLQSFINWFYCIGYSKQLFSFQSWFALCDSLWLELQIITL